jgi:hypothetical protein
VHASEVEDVSGITFAAPIFLGDMEQIAERK